MARLVIVGFLILALTACVSPVDRARKLIALHQEADALYAKGDCSGAIKHYRKLIDSVGGQREPWLRVGNCLARNGDVNGAVDAYRAVLSKDPGYGKAWNNLAFVQAKALARTVLDMQKQLDPNDPAYRNMKDLFDRLLVPFSELVGEPVIKEPSEAPELSKKDPMTINFDPLNQLGRSGQSKSAERSGTDSIALSKMTAATSSSKSSSFDVIKSKNEVEVEVEPKIKLIGKTYTAVASLNVRSASRLGNNIVGGLLANAEFTAVGSIGDWMLIEQNGIRTGYVSTKHIRPSSSQ